MEDRDVDAVLRLLQLRTDRDEIPLTREETISRLMNITLQCLGTIRALVVEQEKIRVSMDVNDIDGTSRDDGRTTRILRESFRGVVKTVADTIVVGQDIDQLDPMKDLIESFPSAYSLGDPEWLILDWTIAGDGVPIDSDEECDYRLDCVHNILEHYPDSLNEIDKKGQHHLSYVLRTNSVRLLEDFLRMNRKVAGVKDGTGKYPIHYAAMYAQTSELLYSIIEAVGKPTLELMSRCADDEGNLPLHSAMSGVCSVSVLKEILFAYPDAVRVPNKEGKLPLHIGSSGVSVEKMAAVFSAFPNAISTADRNGWLPITHAAFACKSVEVVEFLHDAYPEAMHRPHQSGRLPLHYAAVTCYSSKVMKAILDAYPDGASCFDVNRRLPLHNLIARCVFMTPARLRCLRLLLEAYPHGASMAGKDGRTPLDLARRDGHGDLVRTAVIEH